MSDEREPTDLSLEEREFFEPQAEDPDPMGIVRKSVERARSKRSRSVLMFGLFLVFIGVLTWLLFDDLVYFFHSTTPLDLDRAEELGDRPLEHNEYIRVEGIARDMCIRAEVFGSRYRYLYLLGSQTGGRIVVQAPVGPDPACLGAEERAFAGRLVDTARSERYASVVRYYREHFPSAPRQGPVYLLEAELRPRQAWVFPLALVLLLCLATVNFLLLRRSRRRPIAAPEGGAA
jgi:hypothetical protein